MALPLIAAGIAGLAGLFALGCGRDPFQDSNDDAKDPCDGVDCSSRGVCVPTRDAFVCVCDRGYYQQGPECLQDEPQEDGSLASDPEALPDDDHDDAGDSHEVVDEDQEYPYCDERRCYDSHSYECSYTEMKDNKIFMGTRVVECPGVRICEDGMCVMPPDGADLVCGPGKKSACEVTDVHDLIEEPGHASSYSCEDTRCRPLNKESECSTDQPLEACQLEVPYRCGEDAAYMLFGNVYEGGAYPRLHNWYAFDMMIGQPPLFSHYILDLKMDWFDDRYSNVFSGPLPERCVDAVKPVLVASFGDEQRKTINLDETWQSCVLREIAAFTAAGIESGRVRIQLQNDGMKCAGVGGGGSVYMSVLAVAKARIWSCSCVEQDR